MKHIISSTLLAAALLTSGTVQAASWPAADQSAADSSGLACARTVFAQPGLRFMHKVRATNDQASISVGKLPKGLKWNAQRHTVEGIAPKEGRYRYTVSVTAPNGTTTNEPVDLTISKHLQHPVPFMGWLSWNAVESEVSESIVKQVTDLFVSKGLYDCGWNTVMMDDWWHAQKRAADGRPQPDAKRFPNGLEPVSDYVHGHGMRFGIYTDAAEQTCAGAFGSLGMEQTDADAYARWRVDVVKCDYCNAPEDAATARTRYKAMADALERAGYGTMLYICEWGVRKPWEWGAEAGGRCWRVSYDVRDCWTGTNSGVGVMQSIDAMKHLSAYQGVNRFNDADMLCTALHGTGKSSNALCGGKGPGMTQDEYRTQFALWCMWSSPMALSFDPRSTLITDDDYAIMKSRELIALNQDGMGQQGDLVSEEGNMVVFAKDCENGDVALSVTNTDSVARRTTVDFSKVAAMDASAAYAVRDLWAEAYLPDAQGSLSMVVRPHATRVFRLCRKDGRAYLTVAPLSAQHGFSVTSQNGRLCLKMPATKGLDKRIVVSDSQGHAVKAWTTRSENATAKLPSGTYTVSVVCMAQAVRSLITI